MPSSSASDCKVLAALAAVLVAGCAALSDCAGLARKKASKPSSNSRPRPIRV
ncbi:hypothetical protein D3C81_2165590 [compost metagenome]